VDTDRFAFDPENFTAPPGRPVFVGNSRGILRDAVRWSMERNLEIDVYGTGWEPFIPSSMLRGQLVPNAVLSDVYASSRLVLCDHWEDMKRLGYISNRVFDVLAVGGELAVDNVVGLSELVPYGYYVCENADDLERLVRDHRPMSIEKKRKLANWVAENHSFAARARTVLARIRQLVSAEPSVAER
jgi:hypothetical protein